MKDSKILFMRVGKNSFKLMKIAEKSDIQNGMGGLGKSKLYFPLPHKKK